MREGKVGWMNTRLLVQLTWIVVYVLCVEGLSTGKSGTFYLRNCE
jgi:hypothetical protein